MHSVNTILREKEQCVTAPIHDLCFSCAGGVPASRFFAFRILFFAGVPGCPVDVELPELTPPDILFHDTGEKYVASIDKEGLIAKSRLYVHMTDNYGTAIRVGQRHGKPVVYMIDSARMKLEGFTFFCSVNGVWLTKEVPVRFLTRI